MITRDYAAIMDELDRYCQGFLDHGFDTPGVCFLSETEVRALFYDAMRYTPVIVALDFSKPMFVMGMRVVIK